MTLGVELESVEAATEVDLTGSNAEDYLRVDEDWVPAAYEEGGEAIQEVIPMLGVGTSTQIRASLDEVEKYLEIARNWASDKTQKEWIRLKVLEETGSREAHRTVVGGKIVPRTLTGSDYYLDKGTNDNRYPFNLELDVVPGWDIIPASASQTTASLDRFGGQDTLSNSTGTRPAIIDYFTNTVNLTLLADTWIGIRDEREGLTGFTARQELEEGDGTGTDTSEVGGDAFDYGTNIWRTTFATETGLDLRGGIQLSQFDPTPSNWEDYHGRYLIILRARMSALSSKAGVQLRWGFGPANETLNTEVEVEGTQWSLYPLGIVEIPPWPNWGTTHDMRSFYFQFWAERLTGSASLDWDAICLMPTDHLFSMSNNILQIFRKVHIRTRRDWHPFAYGQDDLVYPKTGFAQHFQNWTLPTGSSEIVVASMYWNNSVKTSPSPGSSLSAYQLYHIGKAGFPFES